MKVLYKDKIYENCVLEDASNHISFANSKLEFNKILRIELSNEEHSDLSVGNNLFFYIIYGGNAKDYFYIKSRIDFIGLYNGVSIIDLSVHKIEEVSLSQVRKLKLKSLMP